MMDGGTRNKDHGHRLMYDIYGVHVLDPTKIYVIVPAFEERLPWYRRLRRRIGKWFARIFKKDL